MSKFEKHNFDSSDRPRGEHPRKGKFDTYSTYTVFVRLAMDARVFTRDDGGDDVVLTYCDNSRIENTEELWVDARVHGYHNDVAKLLKKGDTVQLSGKLRFRRGNDGELRGKIYDARLATYAAFGRNATDADVAASAGAVEEDPIPVSFK